MNFLTLVLVNLGRNKIRTVLTFLSVTVALFLFCALGGVLDTLEDAIKVGSETRLITRNAISLVFPMPQSYRERIRAVPGVKQIAIQNWFGGQDPKNPNNFFAQFAVDPEFFKVYRNDVEIIEATPPQVAVGIPDGVDPKLAGYLEEQTACVMGRKLMEKNGWKLGQTITLSGTIYPGTWPYTIRAVYAAKKKAFGEETMLFQFKYLEQKGMGGQGQVGVYVLELDEPSRAASIAKQVDAMFENSSASTRTESEQAFQAGFVSMYGNVPFVLRIIGFAVVFAILLVAANTMVMAVRERTSEIGVLKTLGFEDADIFRTVLAEAAVVTLGGGIAGAMLAKLAIEGSGFNFGGFLPPMSVHWSTVFTGVAIALVLGAVSGLIPAWQASRLRIVDALRRVD
ncbi:MAG: ABC transporter permease [Candidatus Eisenbacteria bacterium]|uniref:ABC transporter permease n=1 Tax=Eiseniibacteriota bacterium TaxID=2212470 RepID=A0A849SJZ0_UNCEI|nr:ABC transporter permease [Candidatus Eisenbacteria bacterium]